MSEGDLELAIHRIEQQAYTVGFHFIVDDPQDQAEVGSGPRQQFLAVLDFERLAECLLSLDMRAYGEALTSGLFADEGLRTAFAQARSRVDNLRLRLRIDASAAELQRLHWETLLDPHSRLPLTTDQGVYFSRYLTSLDWRPVRPRPKGSLVTLAAVAAPAGLEKYELAPIDRTAELALVQSGFEGMPVTALERASLAGLESALTRQPVDVLYLVAHGTFNKNTGEPALLLEGEQGQPDWVNGIRLVEVVRQLEHRPALIVLVSCQGAGAGEGEVLQALGPRLAEAGIRAVLAMQGSLLMDTAARFMPVFLGELRKAGRIDRALAVARGQVRDRPDWWSPVLFMGLKSGRLWYTPGFGGAQGEFTRWDALWSGIQTGRCTPILGPGLTDPLTGSIRDLARQWADALDYPLAPHERESLPQVAQFRAVDQSHLTAETDWFTHLRAAIRRRVALSGPLAQASAPVNDLLAHAGKQLRAQDELEPHRVLAGLPLTIYITANTDELLEDALREAGREPETMVCPWKDFSESEVQDEDLSLGLPAARKIRSAQNPLVYHLFGLLSQPETLVLTEDDTFEFLTGITRNKKKIPDEVGRALTSSALLFLGFQTEDWSFRVLLQALLAKESNRMLRRYAHIAAQIVPEEGRLINPERARRYLEIYFSKSIEIDINIYWGTAREFMQALLQHAPVKE